MDAEITSRMQMLQVSVEVEGEGCRLSSRLSCAWKSHSHKVCESVLS